MTYAYTLLATLFTAYIGQYFRVGILCAVKFDMLGCNDTKSFLQKKKKVIHSNFVIFKYLLIIKSSYYKNCIVSLDFFILGYIDVWEVQA
jgi:hypothetical protein